MKSLVKKYSWVLIGGVLGVGGGYYYYQNWGCTTGYSITSSPLNSMLYGAVMGGLLADMIQSLVQKIKHGRK